MNKSSSAAKKELERNDIAQHYIQNVCKMLDNAGIKCRVDKHSFTDDDNSEYYHWILYDKCYNTICTLDEKDNIVFNMLGGLKFKFNYDCLDQFEHTEIKVEYSFSRDIKDLLDLTTEYIERYNVCKKVYKLYSKEIKDMCDVGMKRRFDDKTVFSKINELNTNMKECFEIECIGKRLSPTWFKFK